MRFFYSNTFIGSNAWQIVLLPTFILQRASTARVNVLVLHVTWLTWNVSATIGKLPPETKL